MSVQHVSDAAFVYSHTPALLTLNHIDLTASEPNIYNSLIGCKILINKTTMLTAVVLAYVAHSTTHVYECIMPLVINSLQRGQFWPGRLLLSMTACGSWGCSAPSSSKTFMVVPVVSSRHRMSGSRNLLVAFMLRTCSKYSHFWI